MRFKSFSIKNFKGIQDCDIKVDGPDPKVFSLIGLNESGKTTILEAINYFVASDVDLQKIYNIENAAINKATFVPKSRKSNFNDDVQISAKICIEPEDVAILRARVSALGHSLDMTKIPAEIVVTQKFQYKNSDFDKSTRTFSTTFGAHKGKAKTTKLITSAHDCWKAYVQWVEERVPQICYFPTFLFDIPEKIYI